MVILPAQQLLFVVFDVYYGRMTELIEENFSFYYFKACKKNLHPRLHQMPLINMKK